MTDARPVAAHPAAAVPAARPLPVALRPAVADLPVAELRRDLAPFVAALAGDRLDAQELEQQVWLHAVERAAGPGLPSDPRDWLRGVAVREARAARGRAALETPVPHPGRPRREPHEELTSAELGRAVRRALAELPGRCPELLRCLAESPELTYTELAARMGVPRGSIGPTRSRCLAGLRALLAARRADWTALPARPAAADRERDARHVRGAEG
ncbi:RNA polymerase sigma factor [Kitasatospora sp. NBC_01539]|uniref:RNA polymerase sigma factor n=1 Tax=Kitasatospora sp. NBC_01539 TaxID=2903577 RepID=UPI0038602F18